MSLLRRIDLRFRLFRRYCFGESSQGFAFSKILLGGIDPRCHITSIIAYENRPKVLQHQCHCFRELTKGVAFHDVARNNRPRSIIFHFCLNKKRSFLYVILVPGQNDCLLSLLNYRFSLIRKER